LKKLLLILLSLLVLLSGCTEVISAAVQTSPVGTNSTDQTQMITKNPISSQTSEVLTPIITPDVTSSVLPVETTKATPTATPKAKPTPTPASSNYLYYKKLAVSSNYTVKQLVGITAVPDQYENPTKDPTLFKITVDLTNKVAKVYKKVGNEYVLYRLMICTTGMSGYSTPKGTFAMPGYYVRFGYFSKYNCYAQYWSQIKGQILFHSILFSRRENTAYRATSYRNLGKAASHGCVRLSVPDAKWVYDNCPKGTLVTINSFAKDADLVKAVQLPVLK